MGIFSLDETTDVGSDAGAPVADDYGPGDNAFTGTVDWVQIDIDAPPRTSTTSSRPRSASASRWRSSRRQRDGRGASVVRDRAG